MVVKHEAIKVATSDINWEPLSSDKTIMDMQCPALKRAENGDLETADQETRSTEPVTHFGTPGLMCGHRLLDPWPDFGVQCLGQVSVWL